MSLLHLEFLQNRCPCSPVQPHLMSLSLQILVTGHLPSPKRHTISPLQDFAHATSSARINANPTPMLVWNTSPHPSRWDSGKHPLFLHLLFSTQLILKHLALASNIDPLGLYFFSPLYFLLEIFFNVDHFLKSLLNLLEYSFLSYALVFLAVRLVGS